MKVIIVKLGGSVITAKSSGRPVFRAANVRRLARELAAYRRRNPQTRLVVLHGAGSFGHPLAHAYGLVGGRLTPQRVVGVVKTWAAMQRLSALLTRELRAAKLPAVEVTTHLAVRQLRGRTRLTARTLVRDLMADNDIPLLGGDVIISDEGLTEIVSADDLAVTFARFLNSQRIIFATDVDGVYRDQRHRTPIRSLSRIGLAEFSKRSAQSQSPTDVTGGMIGKLQKLTRLRGVTVSVINGQKTGQLQRALSGRQIGTSVRIYQ